MASKKTQIDNPIFGRSEVDPTLDSNSDIPYTGSMTRGRIRALTEVYAQTTPIPQSSSVFNTSKIEKSQTASSTQGASKDVAILVNEILEEAQVIVSPSNKEVNLHSKTSRIDFLIEEKEAKPIEEKENKQTKTSTKEKKHEASKATKAAPVLHYVPVTKGKEGQSPFSGDGESVLENLQGLTLPVAKITKSRPLSQPLKGFTRPSQGPIIEHKILPTKRTKEGFDPNVYRLMAKAGYNHEKPSGLGKLIPEASGKEGQKTLKDKGVRATSSKAGVGYTPPTPIRIPI
nr:hypothetical protein CFP56_17977 [Quercus suber]